MKTIGLGSFLWLFMGAIAFGSVPARLEYQGYLTDAVGTPIDCQGCDSPYTFKFSIFDEQADGTMLWSEVHAATDVVQGVFRVELGLGENLDAELLEENRWLEIQINDQAPMVPRQRIISVPYALRASVAEHAIESENAVSLGGHPVESFVQVDDTTGYLNESDLADVLTGLGYSPGDNDSLADINTCAADEILRWDGSAWICGVDQNSDALSTLLCAGGEIAQWDGSAWNCSDALDTLQANIDQAQANIDQVQANVDALDASLDPVAKTGLPADLLDGDDNTQLSEAEVLSMVSGAGYVTGDHFSGAWGELSGVPADLLDGDDNTHLTEAEVLSMVSGAGYVTGDHFSGAWTDVTGIPPDILDGDADTDTLATLGCATGQVPEWNGSAWTCGAGAQWTDAGSHLAASNAPNVVVTNTGRVGVGTASPADYPDEKNNLVIYENANSGMSIISSGTGVASIAFGMDTAHTDKGWIDYHNNSKQMRLGTNGNNTALTIDSDQRVGIGTTNPVTRLEVAGAIKIGNTTTCDASTAGTLRWTGTAIEGCNGVSWADLGGGGPPQSVLYLRKYSSPPEPCPPGWTSAAVGTHNSNGYWNYYRPCYTGQSCAVMYIDKYSSTPEPCPPGWTSVGVGTYNDGGYWNYRRVCTLCD